MKNSDCLTSLESSAADIGGILEWLASLQEVLVTGHVNQERQRRMLLEKFVCVLHPALEMRRYREFAIRKNLHFTKLLCDLVNAVFVGTYLGILHSTCPLDETLSKLSVRLVS